MSFSIQYWWILHDESCQNCTLKSCIPSTQKDVEKGCGNLCSWLAVVCKEGGHL